MLHAQIWPSFYQDSVVLMRLAAALRARPGIDEAAVFLGTPANHDLMAQSGLATAETRQAGPEDLVIVVEAQEQAAAQAALEAAQAFFQARRRGPEDEDAPRPRTLDGALRSAPAANLAAISVPGAYARLEAMRALKRGLSVFLFSDNVPLEDEIALKSEALARDLLCMGPDCGTAYLQGQGLGFYNVVPRGRVGIIAASGTGLQAVASALAAQGEGLSHGIGVGGRDLSAEVEGRMTLRALELLGADPATEIVVLISKPPHPSLLPRLDEGLRRMGKPAVVCCLGARREGSGGALWVDTLDDAAAATLGRLRGTPWAPRAFSDPVAVRNWLAQARHGQDGPPRSVLGLYTGGTLAHEAHELLEAHLGAVQVNPDPAAAGGEGHRIFDLGDDAFTVGHPHPMIDPETRVRFLDAAPPPQGGRVLLFDLVLGRGAHPDPAAPFAAALRRAAEHAAAQGVPLVAAGSVAGTAGDPQDLPRQVSTLQAAGAYLFPSNAEAVRFAALLARPALETELLP